VETGESRRFNWSRLGLEQAEEAKQTKELDGGTGVMAPPMQMAQSIQTFDREGQDYEEPVQK